MAGHSHDDHHVTEQKPVSFTVPFILAAVVILIIILFLSLCDPKPHDAHHGSENPAHAKFEGHHNNPNAREGDMDARIGHSDNSNTSADSAEANHPATSTGTASSGQPAAGGESTTEGHH